jgi:predicted RNA-binding Zn-ribbon protein involved in translation (DUF1610 family)
LSGVYPGNEWPKDIWEANQLVKPYINTDYPGEEDERITIECADMEQAEAVMAAFTTPSTLLNQAITKDPIASSDGELRCPCCGEKFAIKTDDDGQFYECSSCGHARAVPLTITGEQTMANKKSVVVDFQPELEPDQLRTFRVSFRGYIDVTEEHLTNVDDEPTPEDGLAVNDVVNTFECMTASEWLEWLTLHIPDKIEVAVADAADDSAE